METNMPPPSGQAAPQSQGSQGFLKQMEDFFDTYLHKKVPFHLPPNVKEVIVKVGPWITLVLMLLALPVILAALGLSAFMGGPYAALYWGYGFAGGFMLSGLLSLAALILQAVALPGLFRRSLAGWHLVYYSVLVHAVSQLVVGNLINMIVSAALSLYVLFEIRELYR